MRILIVEDEVRLASTLQDLMEMNGYSADICHDGESGLDNALSGIYDMIILDVMLPKLSGFEIMECIEGTPTIFVTAKTGARDRIKGLRLGADDYITKPFNIIELVERVKAVLRRTKATGKSSNSTISALSFIPAGCTKAGKRCLSSLVNSIFWRFW